MSLNQSQIKSLVVADVASAASHGTPANTLCFVVELNSLFHRVVDNTLVANGITILTAKGTDAFWVIDEGGLNRLGTQTADLGAGRYHIDASAGDVVFVLPSVASAKQFTYEFTMEIGDGFTVTFTPDAADFMQDNVTAGTSFVVSSETDHNLLTFSNNGISKWVATYGNSILRSEKRSNRYLFPSFDTTNGNAQQIDVSGAHFANATDSILEAGKLFWIDDVADEIRSIDVTASTLDLYDGVSHASFSVPGIASFSRLSFGNNGAKMYTYNPNNGPLPFTQWTLAVPYDITTAVLDGSGTLTGGGFDMDFNGTLAFSSDGSKIIYPNDSGLVLNSMDISVPWDLTASVLSNLVTPANYVASGSLRRFQFIKNGYGLLFSADNTSSVLRAVQLGIPYDINSFVGEMTITTVSPVDKFSFDEATSTLWFKEGSTFKTSLAVDPEGNEIPGGTEYQAGVISDPLYLIDGNQGSGKVATSDADGRVSWQDIPVSANTRVFASETLVNPATAGTPTLVEIAAFALTGPYTDTILYYTGTDGIADPVTYVYHVDSAGSVTVLDSPSSSANNRVFADATTVAPALVFEPTVAEIAAFATAGSHTDTIIFYTGTDTDTDPTTFVYHVDATGSVTLLNGGATADAERVYEAVNQVGHGFSVNQPIYHDGTGWAAAQADVSTTVAQGIVTLVVDADNFEVTTHGKVAVAGHGLTAGHYYWLDQAASAVTDIQPTSGIAQSLLHVRDANTLFIDVEQAIEAGSTSASTSITVAAPDLDHSVTAIPGYDITKYSHAALTADRVVYIDGNVSGGVGSIVEVRNNATNTFNLTIAQGVGVTLDSEVTSLLPGEVASVTYNAAGDEAYAVKVVGTSANANNRAFADNTTVTPATAGEPTLTEIQTFVTTQTLTDTVVYYTGTDVSTDVPTHVYHVDGAGVVTLIEGPGGVVETLVSGRANLLNTYTGPWTANAWADLSGVTVTLPKAGTYRLFGAVNARLDASATNGGLIWRAFDTTNNAAIDDTHGVQWAGSGASSNDAAANYYEAKVIVSGPTTIKLQVQYKPGLNALTILGKDYSNAPANTFLAYQQLPTHTVVQTDPLAEDLEVVIGSGNALSTIGSGSTHTVLDNGVTWNDLIAAGEYDKIKITFIHANNLSMNDANGYETAEFYLSDLNAEAFTFRVTGHGDYVNYYIAGEISQALRATSQMRFVSNGWSHLGVARIVGVRKQKRLVQSLITTSYSLVEAQTDRNWIDGKPIFERTFDVSASANAIDLITSGVVDKLIGVEGICYNGTKQFAAPYNDGTNYFNAAMPTGSGGPVEVERSGAFSAPVAGEYLTIRYTKV